MKKKIIVVVFISLVLFSSCQWAENKIAQRKQREHFHKRLVWVKNKPRICEKEYILSKINKNKKMIYLGFQGHSCNVYFEFHRIKFNSEDKISLKNRNNKTVICIKNSYYQFQINKILFVDLNGKIIMTDNKVNNNSKLLVFKNIGWGYKIQIADFIHGDEIAFDLFMKYGINRDPWDIKIKLSNL